MLVFFAIRLKIFIFPSLQDCKNSWWADGEFDFHAPGNLKNAAKILRKGLKRDNVSGVIKSLYSTILRDKMERIDFVETKDCSVQQNLSNITCVGILNLGDLADRSHPTSPCCYQMLFFYMLIDKSFIGCAYLFIQRFMSQGLFSYFMWKTAL